MDIRTITCAKDINFKNLSQDLNAINPQYVYITTKITQTTTNYILTIESPKRINLINEFMSDLEEWINNQ